MTDEGMEAAAAVVMPPNPHGPFTSQNSRPAARRAQRQRDHAGQFRVRWRDEPGLQLHRCP